MRTKWTLYAAVLLLLSAAVATAQTPGNAALVAEKESQPTGEPTYEGRVEGETIETPFIIDYLPFAGTGDTCPFLHDYDEACPYDGSTSPDVVYSYYCQYSCTVVIDLCASQYDTKVYVYENEQTPGSPLACNDDYPGCGPNGYRSWIMAEFAAGNTYYIVVDGYAGDCGVYELYIEYLLSVGSVQARWTFRHPYVAGQVLSRQREQAACLRQIEQPRSSLRSEHDHRLEELNLTGSWRNRPE